MPFVPSILCSKQRSEKNIEIVFENNSEQHRFSADPRSAKQILVNILANAIKFSPENGKIDFTVDDMPQQNALRFTIIDQGIGIDPEMMPQLFKPFSQIDSSLSRNFEGTGLGLALVSRLVAMHGGSTNLDSTGHPGEGSTFTIYPAPEPGDRTCSGCHGMDKKILTGKSPGRYGFTC